MAAAVRTGRGAAPRKEWLQMFRRLPPLLCISVFLASPAAAAPPTPPGPALQSSFIWSPSSTPGIQSYVAFRGAVTLSAAPASAELHVFADSRYMLYVNGVYVQRGPCRFNPKRPEFDTAPVTALLHAGENSLVVLVHSYGAGVINGRIMAHAPGLAARLDVDGVVVASTDSTWRCSASTEYRPSPAAWSSIPDVIDARVAPAGGAAWRDAGYNDSAWERAVSVDGAQWGALQPRSIPLPLEAPLSSLSVMPASTPLVLPLVLAPGASVVINLGRMAMTYIDADVQASTSGAALAVVFALRFHDGAPDETYGVGSDYSAAGAGVVRVVGGDTWCAHYVTITAAAGGGGVTLTGLRFVERSYPFVRVGAFASGSDALLTEVWRRAVNTLAVVTDDAYGSDARERNEWLQGACCEPVGLL